MFNISLGTMVLLPNAWKLSITLQLLKKRESRRLRYKEALAILLRKPSLNVTHETLLLPTTIRRNPRPHLEVPRDNSPTRRYNPSVTQPPNIDNPPAQQVRRSTRISLRSTSEGFK